jgi:hypothetical protein
MNLKRELTFFSLIILLGVVVSVAAYLIAPETPLTLINRLFALNGFIALSVAAMMTPFLKEITLFFKGSFITFHHYFAATGLILITLHPIAVFIRALSVSALLPHFDSLYVFFLYGGSIALILIYVAFGAVLLRVNLRLTGGIFTGLCIWLCSSELSTPTTEALISKTFTCKFCSMRCLQRCFSRLA